MHKVANNNGPRTWSSYTNITTKDDRKDFKMNSIENILEYRNLNSTYYSPPLLRKTAATTYDFPEQPAKKDKKWSLGSLFRRKKKEESDSSTDEEADRKGFLNRRKRKSEKKKKIKQRATFDHVIIPATGAPLYNSYNNHDENGILSDPTGGFASYTGRVLARTPNHNRRNNQQLLGSKELVNNVNASRSSLGSADSLCKNTRRVQVKIRAEARRETNICVSSSDEDSQRSASSSRIRSDESINKVHEVTANKKSRAARTERYIRRISKDEELPPGLRLSKSDADNNINRLVISDEKKEVKSSSSRSPMLQNNAKLRVTSQNSGVSTIPPSHSSQKKNNLDNLNAKIHKPPPILTYNPNRYSSLTSTESKDSYPNYQRSISYDADIHKSTSPDAQNEVIHAQLPLGKPSHRYRNLSLVEQPSNPYKHPPPPPPRDPWRIGTTVQHAEHARPMSYCFERNQRTYPTNDLIDNKNSPKSQSFNWRSSVRSTSEDHLPLESSPIPFHPRPSSATADHPNQTFYRQNQESSANTTADQYQYMADKNPRSRKPIFIQSFKEDKKNESPNALEFWKNKKNKQEKSEGVKQPSEAQKALDFWKQKEEEGKQMEKKSPLPPSPQIFTASTHVRTNIFLPSVLKSDMETNEDYKGSSPFKPISPQVLPTDDQETAKSQPENGKSTSPAAIERKSSNLEDALDELEAIYNSLRLGDEDLLERAEERERSIAAKKIMELNSEVYPEGWGAGIPRGAVSDSSFSYEPFEAVESPKRKRQLKKYRNSDRKNDDMAVRKLNKERSSTISDPKEVISKVSYLLASPLHGISDDINVNPGRNHKEPDITYDDMVFRTVKHSNNTLKVSDPQPPFGIPVGPILPACNSDYLHATPDDTPQYTAKNKRIPDIVKDDLAYRNLRKDNGKDPVLPPPMSDDYLNNNNPHAGVPKLTYNNSLKKKRAVRSLSANIYNLIQTEPFIIPISEKKPPEQPKEKSSLNDIADAMEIARQILKEKEEKISATRKAFLSDTETKYKKFETGNSYLAECRMNFLNNMKSKDNDKDQRNEGKRMEHYVTSKPPRGITPEKKSSKESSLSPGDTMKVLSFEKKDQPTLVANNLLLVNNSLVETSVNLPAETTTATAKTELSSPPSDLSNNCLQKSSLEDLLTAFAVEAQEASRRIADELKQLEKNIHFNRNVSATPQSAAVEEIKSFDETNREEVEEVNIEPSVITQIETVEAEETEGMTSHPVSVANVVQTTCEVAPIDDKPVITEVHSDSEHDYVNMGSDAEIEKAIPLIDESVNDSPGCKSPYEEKKADLIAGFQEIKKVASDPELLQTPMSKLDANCDERDNDGDQSGGDNAEQQRIGDFELPRRHRSLSCGEATELTTMSDANEETRAQRIARYKEERRKQYSIKYERLLGQNSLQLEQQQQQKRLAIRDVNSGTAEGPRLNRASRFRAAATAGQDAIKEKATTASIVSNQQDSASLTGSKYEKDKSSKRKSNLNRSLASEEVPPNDALDDAKSRRRRRRFFPPDVLQQTASYSSCSNDDRLKSDTSYTAYNISPLSSPITATATSTRTSPKRSQLSVHMENARRSVISPAADAGRLSRSSPRSSVTSSPKALTPKPEHSKSPISNFTFNGNITNKENIKRKHNESSASTRVSTNKKVPPTSSNERNQEKYFYKNEKLQELLDLTKETLARVEKLTSKGKPSARRSPDPKYRSSRNKSSSESGTDTKERNKKVQQKPQTPVEDRPYNHSILKKKSVEEHEPVAYHPSPSAPVSILKRKVSQDDSKASASSTHTPPVTFSPSVVEPSTSSRKQGILKKRRSLDESQVMRHRSCSPDVDNKSDSRSILKNQRRSSLEEITRTRSPDIHLQSILKRKSGKSDEDPENSLNSPQSILKRRSGASSSGSTSGNQHVSIATAVILAAAGGAEMILDHNDHVKPILKKKSIEEQSGSDMSCETLKPILKKKSSTDTDDAEEKPRPILKSSKGMSDHSDSDTSRFNYRHNFQHSNDSSSECEVRPILKQSNSTEESSRLRLSFHTGEDSNGDLTGVRIRSKRSEPLCTELSSNASKLNVEPDRELRRPRPISVSELVMNFEKTRTSTGAIPKKSSLKRNDRSRTQPVTFNEIEASLSFVQNPSDEFAKTSLSSSVARKVESNSAQSLFDLTTSSSLDNGSRVSLLTASITNISIDSGVGKMSSDSAFQSLGDGLELEDDDAPQPSIPLSPTKLDATRLQMKAIVDEAKKTRLGKGSSGIEKYRNRQGGNTSVKSNPQRYSTQPITFDEVQEASKLNKDGESEKDEADPSKLSLSERIKMFNTKVAETNFLKRDVSKRRQTRFQTQPVTSEEVESARCVSPDNLSDKVLDHELPSFAERKGILKSKLESCGVFKYPYEQHPRSALKHSESMKLSRDRLSPKPILKPESMDFTYDEGISSNDSSSDSESGLRKTKYTGDDDLSREDDIICGRFAHVNIEKSPKSSSVSCSETHTSDESSGGREIRSIIGGDAASKRRHHRDKNYDGLFKSKSHAHVGDELDITSSRVRRSMTQAAMPRSIGEIQAKLKQSGDSDWRKRIPKLNNASEELSLLNAKNVYNEELSEKSILAAKKDELNAASKQWKTRVEKADADKFSVAGRMEKSEKPIITINIPTPDKEKRTPKAKRFKGKEGDNKEPNSGSVSPEEVGVGLGFKRSISVPGKANDDTSVSENSLRSSGRKVRILKPNDDTFTSFFKTSEETTNVDIVDLSLNDLDVIDSHKLLANKKLVKVQRRREGSKNPLRALATRSDIVDEYFEVTTDLAERELKRLNVEKLSKSSSFALEALAGLASKEDFSSVLLKKCSQTPNSSYLPYKDLMLIHVKGRRHVQTRLVNPVVSSINQGDNYILITPNALYNYVGPYSNIIEQSRACDIVNHIQQTGDMGCKIEKTITINPKKGSSSSDLQKFWKLLGASGDVDVANAGHPDEDEIYESNILSTNMIYAIDNDELAPLDDYWGKIPKIEILQPNRVLVFDFGTEMYVWSGITASPDNKKRALKLAKELWSEGYNYSDCGISPLNIAEMIGDRPKKETSMKSDERPEWALFAKITQHRETVLFREKFLDWPDYSRVIKVKQNAEKEKDVPSDINPCDANQMRRTVHAEPDFQIEGTHLGRGHCYFDEEARRQYEISTLGIKSWKILENTYEVLTNDLIGHFYDSETYVIRWQFRVTCTGRELSGKPSKFNQTGRDRCLYFCWLGNHATINEKGAAALLTVELDSENARQIRVPQGHEQPVFFRLFNGKMVTHMGKSDVTTRQHRLYISRGEIEEEASLLEVPCSMRSLRSRSSFIFIDTENGTVFVWHGCKSLNQTRNITKNLAELLIKEKSSHFGLENSDCDTIKEIEEGEESDDFLEVLGDKRLYMSLLLSSIEYKSTPRLFHFSSILGSFTATEILCPYRSSCTTPYPFLQSDLYTASQPALFLFDNGHELWLWQGWWPEKEDVSDLSEQTGSGRVRWQAERKAAMETAINYWKEDHKTPTVIYSVWAGLEPLSFTNLFPTWQDRDDIAELSIKDGKKSGEMVSVETELSQLTRTTYPLAQLLQRPLPEGVDPRQLEIYLSPEDFVELLSMPPADFQKLPAWKQTAIKKEKGLF